MMMLYGVLGSPTNHNSFVCRENAANHSTFVGHMSLSAPHITYIYSSTMLVYVKATTIYFLTETATLSPPPCRYIVYVYIFI